MSSCFDYLATGQDIDAELKHLARFTDVEGEMTRLTLSPAHKRAIDYLTTRFKAAGMAVELDAMGSLHGIYNPHQSQDIIVIGSHIDTVRNAGIYDGNLGVIIGLKVIEALAASKTTLPFGIQLIAFGDEEGVRFPTTLTGSSFVAGHFNPSWLDEKDADGISRADALTALGAPNVKQSHHFDQRIKAYLEVHIEQGPVLQAHDVPLGIVSAINGVTRGHIVVQGMAGHAGTLPMAMRQDAVTACAEMILAFEQRARQTHELVATNGVITIKNPAINVVAGEAHFSFDLRSPRDDDRLRALDDLRETIAAIAQARHVSAQWHIGHQARATPCDEHLMAGLSKAAHHHGITALTLPSGAGHDAMAFRHVVPLAMLFVRCHDGISHNPREAIRHDDVGVAAQVLLTTLLEMAQTKMS